MASTTSAQSLQGVDPPHANSRSPLKYLLLIIELLILLKVVQVFEIEARSHLLLLMCLATGGFVVHHRLVATYRPHFFLLLSLTAFVLLLGWQNAALIVAIGAALIGICHLPIALVWRVTLLMGAAAVLAYLRVAEPWPFWPILGSVFMFRLPVYLREMNRSQTPVTLSQRLSYFFLLPNACFPFFPLLDYQVFVNSYRNEEDDRIAQSGIAWMVRGIVHLILYRLVKYHLLPPPDDILNIEDVVVFLAANYALYLRVSGTFHLITGLLHLFGFNVPRTHDWFFLASSFSDIWRRINIYWKDFLTQHIFFPAFFYLRAAGNWFGIVAAVALVFVCTWLFHSYQVFWLIGDFPLRGSEAGLWLAAGLVVAVNSLFDYQRARRAKLRRAPLTLLQAVGRSLQIVGVFMTVSIFWACWTQPGMFAALTVVSRQTSDFMRGWDHVLGALLIVIAALTAVPLISERLVRRGWRVPFPFEQSPIPVAGVLLLLLVLGHPSFPHWFGADTSRVLASLTVDYPTTLDLARSVPGYYEELAAANLQADALFATEKPKPRTGELQYSDITRERNDLLELEVIPRWKGTLAGAPISINRWGMRDGPVFHEKPANTSRIAVMGSSVVMGFGVRDDEVFTELLERRLNETVRDSRFEVLNFGVGRYYALHIAAALREKVYAFQPDAVFYVAHQGEIYGVVPHLAKYRFARHDLLYACLDDIIRHAGISDDTSWGSTQALLQPHAKEITRCIYRGIVDDCRSRGILPVWIYLPMPGVVEVPADNQELVSLAKEAGFSVLDLSHWADGRRPEEVKLNAADHHANVLGHQLIAEQLFALLRDNPQLLPFRPQ